MVGAGDGTRRADAARDRKSTRLNSSHSRISYAVFCLKKKKNQHHPWNYSLLDTTTDLQSLHNHIYHPLSTLHRYTVSAITTDPPRTHALSHAYRSLSP